MGMFDWVYSSPSKKVCETQNPDMIPGIPHLQNIAWQTGNEVNTFTATYGSQNLRVEEFLLVDPRLKNVLYSLQVLKGHPNVNGLVFDLIPMVDPVIADKLSCDVKVPMDKCYVGYDDVTITLRGHFSSQNGNRFKMIQEFCKQTVEAYSFFHYKGIRKFNLKFFAWKVQLQKKKITVHGNPDPTKYRVDTSLLKPVYKFMDFKRSSRLREIPIDPSVYYFAKFKAVIFLIVNDTHFKF